jgi:hypothetical protein
MNGPMEIFEMKAIIDNEKTHKATANAGFKGTMKIEIAGHSFKDNPKRTKIPLGKLKLPEGSRMICIYTVF